jgi:uncharacterized membrane protein YkoI
VELCIIILNIKKMIAKIHKAQNQTPNTACKRVFLIILFMFAVLANTARAQDLHQSQVPSLTVNSFQKSFPKAFDIEWEQDGEHYKVEFETGLLGTDHTIWYNKTGKVIRHKEEISKSKLPQKVLAKINSNFRGYRVDEVEKIAEGGKIIYTLELESLTKEWKVAFDSEGNILSKVAD